MTVTDFCLIFLAMSNICILIWLYKLTKITIRLKYSIDRIDEDNRVASFLLRMIRMLYMNHYGDIKEIDFDDLLRKVAQSFDKEKACRYHNIKCLLIPLFMTFRRYAETNDWEWTKHVNLKEIIR